MKIFSTMFSLLPLLVAGCSYSDWQPYDDDLHTLHIEAVYPDGYDDFRREGVELHIEDVDRGHSYSASTDASGAVTVQLTNGIYRVIMADRCDGHIFNGTADRIMLVGRDVSLELRLSHSMAGSIVIKEIYCGGCLRLPQEGVYQSDKYIMLHNNDSQVQYLDGLCFGVADPYNSQGSNHWLEYDDNGTRIFTQFVPIIQAVLRIGGTGESFPLQPGEDAVICCCGAIDHSAQYPLSVNLNREEYFAIYNPTYFPNTMYHPAPGDKISPERYLEVVIKTGIANAYPLSIFSPAPVIFRPKGMTMEEFVRDPENVIPKPADRNDYIVKVPNDWIIDGVEVFFGGSSSNNKRLSPQIDAGYVTQSDTYLGRSLHRRTDEAASAAAGYEILVDTNNSSADFYERSKQSLHE